MNIKDIIDRWNTNEGEPYKGALIDWRAYEADPANMGCMCAQGQVLHAVGGWDYTRLRDAGQSEADEETAKLLNISRAHAILLRNVNDRAEGAPSVVLTDPSKVLGDQWCKLLDFWWMFDDYSADDWQRVAAAGNAAGNAARNAAGNAAGNAAWDAAWDAAGNAAGNAAWNAARNAAGNAAGNAAWAAAWDAAWEIQGYHILSERGHKPFFLPMFGLATLDDIPARPADYGNGIVPVGEA